MSKTRIDPDYPQSPQPPVPGPRPPLRLEYAPFDPSRGWFEPRRVYSSDAGFDLVVSEYVTVPANQVTRIPHNLRIAFPEGYYGLIMPRSSTVGRGLIVQPGTVDQGYRGEVMTVVYSLGRKNLHLQPGDRISHLLVLRRPHVELALVDPTLSELASDRGTRGFGSSGT